MVASSYPFLDVMWSMFIFFAWVIWIWFLIYILTDVYRRHDLSGLGKAGWTILLIFVPFLAALIYLIKQGGAMAERRANEAQDYQAQTDQYIRSVVSPSYKGVEEIARGKELLDQGAISPEEFEQIKRRVLV